MSYYNHYYPVYTDRNGERFFPVLPFLAGLAIGPLLFGGFGGCGPYCAPAPGPFYGPNYGPNYGPQFGPNYGPNFGPHY